MWNMSVCVHYTILEFKHFWGDFKRGLKFIKFGQCLFKYLKS